MNIAGNDKLQLMAAAWGKNKEDMMENKKAIVNDNDFFPCLDMEMFWMETDDLNFWVHLKPNQQLKHLNSGSHHHPAVFKLITMGAFKWLTKLTLMNKNAEIKRIDELCPSHAKALKTAWLEPKTCPTLWTIQDEEDNEKKKKERNKKERDTRTEEQCFFALHAQKTGRSQYPRQSRNWKRNMDCHGCECKCHTLTPPTFTKYSKLTSHEN